MRVVRNCRRVETVRRRLWQTHKHRHRLKQGRGMCDDEMRMNGKETKAQDARTRTWAALPTGTKAQSQEPRQIPKNKTRAEVKRS